MKNLKNNLSLWYKHLNKINIATIFVLALMVMPIISGAQTISRYLSVGSTGSDVSTLQSFLARDTTIYPQGLVTGYFGPLTRSAVMNFQARNGISQVGQVGPITLAEINRQIAMGGNVPNNTSLNAPVITSVTINPSRTSATLAWTTNELARGQVYYSTNPIVANETMHDVEISGTPVATTDGNFKIANSASLQGLESDTTYYYMIYTKDPNNNVTVTWPSLASSFRTDD